MKTKWFFLCAIVITLISFSILQKEEYVHSSLYLMTIEALANPEGGGSSGGFCVGFGSVDCPISNVKVLYVR